MERKFIKELAKKIFVFNYSIMENDEFGTIAEDGIPMQMDENTLVWFARKWSEGKLTDDFSYTRFPLTFRDALCNKIRVACEDKLEEEGCDFEDCTLRIQPMPLELELALKRLNGMPWNAEDYSFDPLANDPDLLHVDLHYYYTRGDKEYDEVCPYALRSDLLHIMQLSREDKPAGVDDFSFLKQMCPDAYEYVYRDIHTWCNNLHLPEYGEVQDIELRDFPTEVLNLAEAGERISIKTMESELFHIKLTCTTPMCVRIGEPIAMHITRLADGKLAAELEVTNPFVEEGLEHVSIHLPRTVGRLLTLENVTEICAVDEFPSTGGCMLDGYSFDMEIALEGGTHEYSFPEVDAESYPLTKALTDLYIKIMDKGYDKYRI